MKKSGTKAMEDRIRASLDAREAEIDAASRHRLVRARAAAVAATERTAWWQGEWALPVAGVAAVAAVAIAVTVSMTTPVATPDMAMLGMEDELLAELVLGDVELEMLEEDIDFYEWLTLAKVDADLP